MTRPAPRIAAAVILLSLALVACGGGGNGDNGGATPTPRPTPTPLVVEAETVWTNPDNGTVVVIRKYENSDVGIELVYFYPPLSPEMAATVAAAGLSARATEEATTPGR